MMYEEITKKRIKEIRSQELENYDAVVLLTFAQKGDFQIKNLSILNVDYKEAIKVLEAITKDFKKRTKEDIEKNAP